MKHLFHRKSKIKWFTWFRLGLLGALLLAAGSLYTPYPAELVKALSSQDKATKKKKKRKVVKPATPAPADTVAAPAKPVAPLEPDEEEVDVEPWSPQEAFSMPTITLPPFPPALPESVEPGRYDHISKMTPGLNVLSSVQFEEGTTA